MTCDCSTSAIRTTKREWQGGVLLAVAALVPLVLALGAPFLWGSAYGWPWAFVGAIGSAVTFVWCVRTAWRLLSGRPRRDGGLLSLWVIAGAGVLAAVGTVWGLLQFGLRWSAGALYLGSIAVGSLHLTRRRFGRQGGEKGHAA